MRKLLGMDAATVRTVAFIGDEVMGDRLSAMELSALELRVD